MAYASLTGPGRQLLKEMPATAEGTVAEVFAADGWSEDEIRLLSALLTRLGGTGIPGKGGGAL